VKLDGEGMEDDFEVGGNPGRGLGANWMQTYGGGSAQWFPACNSARFDHPLTELPEIKVRQQPVPPLGWRRIPPADAYSTSIGFYYAMELAELAREQGFAVEGVTLRCDYRKVDGEWFPIPESLRVEEVEEKP